MRLSNNNFSSTQLFKRFSLFGKHYDTKYARYTYETNKRIYDVDISTINGDKTYHVNCGFSTEPETIHRAIEKHFSI